MDLSRIQKSLPVRTPRAEIPASREIRQRLRQLAADRVQAQAVRPPVSMDWLWEQSSLLLESEGLDKQYAKFALVTLHSEIWRETLGRIPFSRRLLLMPKCLRHPEKCQADIDEIGLTCHQCGQCVIGEIQAQAERLGYAVLCAEGTGVVTGLIKSGKVDAVVGVSCLEVLEKAFPHMEAAGIPGYAIPLHNHDCRESSFDLDCLWEILHYNSGDSVSMLNLDLLQNEVGGWFAPSEMTKLMGLPMDPAGEIARQALCGKGKRWRPFLLACVHRALNPGTDFPDSVKKLAVAVECFHKASLIHDDIEDNDDYRYGEKTVHAVHGVPIALNVGDWLVGEGYRLIADCGASGGNIAAMIKIAAEGHRTLCEGQGDELQWITRRSPLTVQRVLDIFRKKTAPAFEVALRLGAAQSGHDDELGEALKEYSRSMGIAYQVRDDLEDMESGDLTMGRPTLPLALAWENAGSDERRLLESGNLKDLASMMSRLNVRNHCQGLMASCRVEAIRALSRIRRPALSALLRRVLVKVFGLDNQGLHCESQAELTISHSQVAPNPRQIDPERS